MAGPLLSFIPSPSFEAGAHERPRRSRIARLLAISALMAVVFISDTITDLEIATAVFYIVAILLAVGHFQNRHVVLVAITCVALTVLSFLLTKSGSREAGIVNFAISVSAISITTFIALKMVSAEKAVHEARAQLIRIARVNSLGEVATSIAHEVNQPLSAIATSGDACLRWLAASPPNIERARLAVERVIQDAERAGAVIARIREHAKGRPPERRMIAIDELVRDTVALWQSVIDRSDITLKLVMAEQALTVPGDGVQLQQVLGNLILNAVEAMTKVQDERALLTITTLLDEEGDIKIAVEDNGPGIQEEHMAHVFESFWTTKQDGTGIGLAISRTIVEAHGGAIEAERLPHGSRFCLRLPTRQAMAA